MGVQLLPQSLKVKTLSYTITMPVELRDRILAPTSGKGGWQTLMASLRSQVEGETLELPQVILTKMIPLATKHGAGGYQSVIRWILCLLLAQHMEALIGTPQTLKGALGLETGTDSQTETDTTTTTDTTTPQQIEGA